jgi:hypothetical protein
MKFRKRQIEMAVAAEAEEDDPAATSSRAARASSTAARMACEDSGAGRMPSVRANWTAASNTGSCE